MKKSIAILGTMLITVTILISGSGIAPWFFVDHYEPLYTVNCTSPGAAVGAPDDEYASLGEDNPPVLGLIVLDLDRGNEMGPDQEFTVFANSSVSEIYNVSISETATDDGYYLGSNEDTEDHNFTTPSTPGKEWRYIIMWGWTGSLTPDYHYGPDIDAVGWYQP